MFWLKNTSCCLCNIFHWYRISPYLLFFTLLPGPCLGKALSTSQHTQLTSLSIILTNGNTYQLLWTFLAVGLGLVTRFTDVSMATPWTRFVFVIDSSSCYDRWDPDRASGLMHSLRLELWAWAEGCTAEGSEGTPAGEGVPQRGRTHKRKLLSRCQTSRLSFLIHQSITIQRCY